MVIHTPAHDALVTSRVKVNTVKFYFISAIFTGSTKSLLRVTEGVKSTTSSNDVSMFLQVMMLPATIN